MILNGGDKVFIITRRLFDGDLRRHFVGEVEEATDAAARVRGYAFVFDATENEFVRRDRERVRIFGISDSGLIVLLLQDDTDPAEVRYATDEDGSRTLTDGGRLSVNVSEFGATR